MSEGKRQAPDWERIELEYRAGVLSIREIASNHGVSHTAIQKKAKAQDWVRDISQKVQAKANNLVAKKEVANKVATENAKSKVATEKAIIEANAQTVAEVRLAHRSDIRKAKALMMALMDELSSQTIERELYENLGELLRNEDEKGMDKLNDLYMKVMSTPSRIVSMQKLADTMKTLIDKEREAYNIESVEKLDITSSDKSMTPTVIERVIIDPPKRL